MTRREESESLLRRVNDILNGGAPRFRSSVNYVINETPKFEVVVNEKIKTDKEAIEAPPTGRHKHFQQRFVTEAEAHRKMTSSPVTSAPGRDCIVRSFARTDQLYGDSPIPSFDAVSEMSDVISSDDEAEISKMTSQQNVNKMFDLIKIKLKNLVFEDFYRNIKTIF